MKYSEIKRMYEALSEKTSNEFHNDNVKKILEIGLVCCNNDALIGTHPILLTGINPSVQGGLKEFIFKDTTGTFWIKKKNQFGPLVNEMAYMDLFPLRVSRQDSFEKVLKEENKLRAEFLSITQDAIENLQPRLIIHANRASLYYWGLSKKAEINPWMGYKFRPLNINDVKELDFISEERLRRFPFYIIEGDFIDSCKRINHDRFSSTSLQGTIFVEYVMEERREDLKKLMYNTDEWQKIWSWIKVNKR